MSYRRKPEPRPFRKHERRRAQERLRRRVIELYGGSPPMCALCDQTEFKALSLDHINGDGAEERRRVVAHCKNTESDTRQTWRLALAQYRPDRYRVLCMNCQFIEREKPYQKEAKVALDNEPEIVAEPPTPQGPRQLGLFEAAEEDLY